MQIARDFDVVKEKLDSRGILRTDGSENKTSRFEGRYHYLFYPKA